MAATREKVANACLARDNGPLFQLWLGPKRASIAETDPTLCGRRSGVGQAVVTLAVSGQLRRATVRVKRVTCLGLKTGTVGRQQPELRQTVGQQCHDCPRFRSH